MALKFNNAWRFTPPEDGRFCNKEIPAKAIDEFFGMASKVATQGSRQGVLETFKREFASAAGSSYARSSNESWAQSDLEHHMRSAASNAPLFIEAFFDATASLERRSPDWWIPDETFVNSVLRKHNIGYEIRGQDLVQLETQTAGVVPVQNAPTLAEKAAEVLQLSLQRSEQLLSEGRAREAVQEILWLLETVATAFRGVETHSGTVEGKYFNQIVRDLRAKHHGTTLERILDWVANVHGYLSSPTGGGIRHGLDLNSGVELTQSDARLYCNLVRSYLGYLLTEHERITKQVPR
ncbi:hypothetical protein [Desulfonatronum thiodismutans]|uniref:hypothetical protein n=1 Tax=Desulfonatronum thiodismutans TaxID=159290 RepID=UPI0004ABE2C6|nr:hypothetical protein [Desulfonatronum thiodismutans]